MTTTTTTKFTNEAKIEILTEIAKKTSQDQTKWVTFNYEGFNEFNFSDRLEAFKLGGLQEIYTVNHEDVQFLGYLIENSWVNIKLANNPLDIIKKTNRRVWSQI